jgi:hypothetical protein
MDIILSISQSHDLLPNGLEPQAITASLIQPEALPFLWDQSCIRIHLKNDS